MIIFMIFVGRFHAPARSHAPGGLHFRKFGK